jgi:hypothetical protein
VLQSGDSGSLVTVLQSVMIQMSADEGLVNVLQSVMIQMSGDEGYRASVCYDSDVRR